MRRSSNVTSLVEQSFYNQSLENYLLALSASDDHDNNTLRFTALWLEHSEESMANEAVFEASGSGSKPQVCSSDEPANVSTSRLEVKFQATPLLAGSAYLHRSSIPWHVPNIRWRQQPAQLKR